MVKKRAEKYVAVICEAGSAPMLAEKGHRGLGVIVQGTDEEVLRVFGFGDIQLVRGGCVNRSESNYEFYPMVNED
jgi:ribosomal protein S5